MISLTEDIIVLKFGLEMLFFHQFSLLFYVKAEGWLTPIITTEWNFYLYVQQVY